METFEIRKTVLEKFLGFLANPTVAYLLLALGVIGIFIEFFMGAGLIMPGFAGVICLALSFVAMNIGPSIDLSIFPFCSLYEIRSKI